MMKKEILMLIQDDILNTQLITTLNKIGIDASNYAINSDRVVFKLIGIESDRITDNLYRKYFNLLKRAKTIDSARPNPKLKSHALRIYDYLVNYRDTGVFNTTC